MLRRRRRLSGRVIGETPNSIAMSLDVRYVTDDARRAVTVIALPRFSASEVAKELRNLAGVLDSAAAGVV